MAGLARTDQREEAVLLILIKHKWLHVDCIDHLSETSHAWRTPITRHRLRRRAIVQHGFAAFTRLRFWLQETKIAELLVDATSSSSQKRDTDAYTASSLYLQLLQIESDKDQAPLMSTSVEGEISRDVDRTFPMDPFFAAQGGEGQRQLGNVLKAVALHVPEIGYCQGMNYVVAALLMQLHQVQHSDEGTHRKMAMAPQPASFWLVVALIRRFGMDELWRPKMPGLSRSIHIYQQLLRLHFYDLHTHLRKIGMHASVLVTQWFATLFARVLSLDVLVRVWDVFLVDGWKMLFRVALAITAHVRPRIINMDMEECSDFFRKHPKLTLERLSANELLTSALSFKLTRKMLRQMDEERNLEYLRLRLQKAPLSHEHALLFPMLDENGTLTQKESLDFIRSQLHEFDSNTASDMGVLRNKIEAVDRTIAQATSALAQTSYALSDVTFTLADHSKVRRTLRRQFDTLLSQAIGEASSPSSSQRAKAKAQQQQKAGLSSVFKILEPTIGYMQQSLAGCFDRAAAVRFPPMVTRQGSWMTGGGGSSSPSSASTVSLHDNDLEEDDETRRNLIHLELLVPHHSDRLHSLHRATAVVEKELRRAQRKYEALQKATQLAQMELEEAQQFKDRLADQMLQLMLTMERQKNVKMQQLFAQVDHHQECKTTEKDREDQEHDEEKEEKEGGKESNLSN